MMLSMRNLARPIYGHWIAPMWTVRGLTAEEGKGNAVDPIEEFRPSVRDFTWVVIANLNDHPVKVIINFFDKDGNFVPEVSTVMEALGPRSSRDHKAAHIPMIAAGHIIVSCTHPVYPAAYVNKRIRFQGAFKSGHEDTLTHVEIPVPFYPIYEPDMIVPEQK